MSFDYNFGILVPYSCDVTISALNYSSYFVYKNTNMHNPSVLIILRTMIISIMVLIASCHIQEP
jgi:hypothetical protein